MSELWAMVTVFFVSTTFAAPIGGALAARMERRITGAVRHDPRFRGLRMRAHLAALYGSGAVALVLLHFWMKHRGGVRWFEIVGFVVLMTTMTIVGEVILYRRSVLR